MLDLEELEKMLDETLDRETQESMTEWLLNKRQENQETSLYCFLDIEIEEFHIQNMDNFWLATTPLIEVKHSQEILSKNTLIDIPNNSTPPDNLKQAA